MKKILVVDDEQALCEILQFNLEAAGYEVYTANSAEEAMTLAISDFNLILLDVMMEGMSGFDLARRLRSDERTANIPIIFITALDNEDDRVTGLNIGGDDYIAKPFSIREVTARIAAVLRRTTAAEKPETNMLGYEGIQINLDQKTVRIDGEDVPFTKTEIEILSLFLKEPGRIFSRKELIDIIWPNDVVVLKRTVDVNITRLRKKIGKYSDRIVTRQGYGYFFKE
ncbi:MAG: response regulator transcription factor [Prevotella sp.]|uniref:response regulator transcription factor n=1 Tax=Prevotella sp. TaxID=59823 RepID=UPI002A2A8E0C|nr:response regulator transcription factor [Prevotella sp.]MDD7318869.1 response regulator transcription factor [Prevotellaceae bacterium]MDY4019247.1 response regulator transcription factor [Prevotella sp.]